MSKNNSVMTYFAIIKEQKGLQQNTLMQSYSTSNAMQIRTKSLIVNVMLACFLICRQCILN